MQDNCILWPHAKDGKGYGILKIRIEGKRKTARAHRVTWEKAHGSIPKGMYICHRCDNPPCINLDHLFLGTPSDNAKDRAQKKRGVQERKTHCPRGHPYSLENTYVFKISEGRRGSLGRHCKICVKRRSKEERERRKLAGGNEI